MPKGSLNVSLKGADDIFSTEESRQEPQREQVHTPTTIWWLPARLVCQQSIPPSMQP